MTFRHWQPRKVRIVAVGASLLLAATAQPALAETMEELDALSDIATDEKSGIAAAGEQAQRGEFLEALATLERVLSLFPKSKDARLLHAIYLCKVDDRQGGLVELSQLKAKEFGEETLQKARALCGEETAQ
jgi:Flp pilus assembly protein TadD